MKRRFVTNEELIAVTGVSRQSLNLWVKKGLLPAPTLISDGKSGVRSRWPAEALERAKFIVEARRHYALTANGQSGSTAARRLGERPAPLPCRRRRHEPQPSSQFARVRSAEKITHRE